MAASIGHRVTGAALYFGAFLLAGWVVALAASPVETDAFKGLVGLIASPIGQIIVGLWLFAILLHALNGLRYLFWSGPKMGFDPQTANRVTIAIIIVAAISAIAIWFAAFNIVGN